MQHYLGLMIQQVTQANSQEPQDRTTTTSFSQIVGQEDVRQHINTPKKLS